MTNGLPPRFQRRSAACDERPLRIMRPGVRLGIIFLTGPVIAFTLVGGFLGQAVAPEDVYRHLRIFEDVVSHIAENYVEEVELEDVMQGALRGLSSGLDSDSVYLSAEDVLRIEAGQPLPEGGLGVEVSSQYYLQIVAVRDRSPAARAGLLPGDYVRAINDQTTRLVSAIEGQRLLRGEPGSSVRLSLLRGNTSESYDISLVRERPQGTAVTTRLLSTELGYIRVPGFENGMADQIETAVSGLGNRGATRLIVDVRSTAGGSYEEGIAASRLFVASGTLLRRAEHGDQQITIEATAGSAAIDIPLVVLIDGGTAHAAELFAAGLHGCGRADMIGRHSAGRVSLQRLVKLPDGTGLWLSWARYLHGSGDPIHRTGVEPTVQVAVPVVELGEPLPAGDAILERALEHLRTRVASRDRRVAQLVRAPA